MISTLYNIIYFPMQSLLAPLGAGSGRHNFADARASLSLDRELIHLGYLVLRDAR